MEGHPPIVKVTNFAPGEAPPITEQRKYQRMWERAEYRQVAPGEQLVAKFMDIVRPPVGATIIDFGAGTGRGACTLAMLGMKVQMLDFAPNCLDAEVFDAMFKQHIPPDGVPVLKFAQQDLTQKINHNAQFGYCTDVMEHIPTADVDKVLGHILMSAQHVFFQISCVDDSCGKLIGHVLHHTVQPYAWWMQKFQAFGAVVHHSEDHTDSCIFYVSAWQDAKRFVETGGINTTEEVCLENMRTNMARGLPEVSPHQQNDFEVVLLAGGPSLNDHVDEIRALCEGGAKLITVNATYQWAFEHSLRPNAMVMVDAREHNNRFVEPIHEKCTYFMASQVHPTVLDKLLAPQLAQNNPRVMLWHTGMESSIAMLNERKTPYYVVPTGSSVVLRAFSLLLMLGYHKFHVFGFDSCLRDGQHHAYAQQENDGQHVTPVTCGARIFYCHPWMVSQAQEFQDLVRVIGEHIDCHIYGNGMIAEMIKTGAQLAEAQEFQLE